MAGAGGADSDRFGHLGTACRRQRHWRPGSDRRRRWRSCGGVRRAWESSISFSVAVQLNARKGPLAHGE